MKFFRITAFDLVRALSVFNLVFMHVGVFDWKKVSNTKNTLPETEPPTLFQQIMFYCLSQGGMFHVISSGLFAFSSILRLTNKKNSLFQILLGGWISGLYMLFIHAFVELIVGQGTGWLYLFIYPGKSPIATWHEQQYTLLHNGTAAAIATNFLVISCVVCFLFRNGGYKKEHAERNVTILMFLFVVIMIATPFVRIWMYKYPEYYVDEGNLFLGILAALTCGNYFPMFPYLAYGFLGTGFGIFLVYKFPIKKFVQYFLIITLCFQIVGYSVLYLKFGQLYIGLFEEKSVRGMIFRSALQYSQVNYFLTPFVIFVAIFDLRSEKVRKWYKWLFSGLFRLQKISLTVYTWEGILKSFVHYLWDWVFPEWDLGLGTVMAFGFFNYVIWYFIAMAWEKINYWGSHEWFYNKTIEWITGKKTRRLEYDPIMTEKDDKKKHS